MMDTKKLAARVSPHFMFAGDVKSVRVTPGLCSSPICLFHILLILLM